MKESLVATSSRSAVHCQVTQVVHHNQKVPLSAEDGTLTVASHPLGIKPSGNAYTAKTNIKLATGNLCSLPDEILVQILEFLDVPSLESLCLACKFFYAFSRFEELWKELCIKSVPSIITWRGTWRGTYLSISKEHLSTIDCNGLFSDILHRPFLCAHTSLLPYSVNVPPQNQIARLYDLSAEEFTSDWTGKPFILSHPVTEWPIYKEWSTDSMLQKYGNIKFRAESVDWPLKTYIDYMDENEDESPLYLFDRLFVEKMEIRVGKNQGGQYWPPSCFGEDLFSVLGNRRPDSRWLIVGPERSGSTFHKDPNATSAWNAVLRGSKYWIMFPATSNARPPPGVFVSEDQSEVTSPLSIAEWLLGFHAEARRTPGCKEGVCYEGEVLHVPSGWWHLVVNLDPSIAITQNFVPEKHLPSVLDFLKNQPQSISGFSNDVNDAYALFVKKMGEKRPDVLHRGMEHLARLHGGKKRKWEQLIKTEPNETAVDAEGFSFGLEDGGEEDIP